MVTPHQNILKPLGKTSKRFNLDTPYGFQENADELTERIFKYFEVNVGYPIANIEIRNVSQNKNVESIDSADWVFSGPGSPTYALKVWRETGADKALTRLLERGSIVMASAAAMTLGAETMPVYEMYKVGEEPRWLEGLNILESATGIKAAVVAHYNNTQGGTHDTRFCFVGERRMKQLESMLDSDTAVLGLDEHTGIIFDLEAGSAEVVGKGNVTFRKNGQETVFPAKSILQTTSLR